MTNDQLTRARTRQRFSTFARKTAAGYVQELQHCLGRLDTERIGRAAHLLRRAYLEQSRVFLAGNGGSACTASHIATDLAKTVRGNPANPLVEGFCAVALTDNVGVLTAYANDEGFERVFDQQLRGLAKHGDVLIAISGSGNSPNIVAAAAGARAIGLQTIGFLGMGGGRLRAMVDVPIVVASDDYGIIEDAHMALGHLLTRMFRQLTGDLLR